MLAYAHGMPPTRRSDATRSGILAAARVRFAADGYERATIRAVAADARIDPSMVMRYFGSKEGLFAAAAEFDLQLPDLASLPRASIGEAVIRHFLRLWDSGDELQLLLRTGATNASAAERMQQIFAEQLVPGIAAIQPAGTPKAEIADRAGLAASQVLGVAMCRYVLRLPPMASMAPATMVSWLAPTLQRYLAGPAPG